MRHTDTIIQKLKNNPKIDDKDNCSYRVRSAKDVIENSYAPIDVLNIDVQDLSDSGIAIIQSVTALATRMGTAETNITNLTNRVGTTETNITNLTNRVGTTETNITNLNKRLPSTIRFRVNGTTLQASVDSGSTWKNVVVG